MATNEALCNILLPPAKITTPIHDFGIQLGHAPQIVKDSFIWRDDKLEQLWTCTATGATESSVAQWAGPNTVPLY